MPILLEKYIFSYFLNECSGLAEIKAAPIFAGGLKPVKSLTMRFCGMKPGKPLMCE